jgi:hypothetical protein
VLPDDNGRDALPIVTLQEDESHPCGSFTSSTTIVHPGRGELYNILDCVSSGTSKVHGYQEPSMGVASL